MGELDEENNGISCGVFLSKESEYRTVKPILKLNDSECWGPSQMLRLIMKMTHVFGLGL